MVFDFIQYRFVVKTADTVIADGLTLPVDERRAVVEALVASLADETVEVEPEQASMLSERIASLERGEVQPVAGTEVRVRMRALLSRD